NRTEARGKELIAKLGFGEWMEFSKIGYRLGEFDIVIVSTAAPDYIITHDVARAASDRRSGNPQLIVYLSVPRNVDPRVGSLSGIFCKDITDLSTVIESNVERRRDELPRAELIIEQELARFNDWYSQLSVTPVIAELKERSDSIL